MIGSVPPAADLLAEFLRSANRVARRLRWSRDRVAGLLPTRSDAVDQLGDEEEERLDALLLRFNALTAMLQDHVARALLVAEEEDIKDRSRKDQRLLLEKLGALPPALNFASMAELRNRIAHPYPDDSDRQAQILNGVFARTDDLLRAHDAMLTYADGKIFGGALGLDLMGDGAIGSSGTNPGGDPRHR